MLKDYKWPDTNKVHRCPECYAVMYEGEGLSGVMPRFYRLRVQHCYRCGAKVLPSWVRYAEVDEWRWRSRRLVSKVKNAVDVVSDIRDLDDLVYEIESKARRVRLDFHMFVYDLKHGLYPRTYLAYIVPDGKFECYKPVVVLGVARSEKDAKHMCEKYASDQGVEIVWDRGLGRVEGSDETYRVRYLYEGSPF